MTEQELYRKLGIGYRQELIYAKLRKLEETLEPQFTQGLMLKPLKVNGEYRAVVHTPIGQTYEVDIFPDSD